MTSNTEPVEVIVAETYRIKGRGTAATLADDPRPWWPVTAHRVRVVKPDGVAFETDASVELLLRNHKDFMALVFPLAGLADLPPGSRVTSLKALARSVKGKEAAAHLTTAANGLAWISTHSRSEYWRLCFLLVFRHGFVRWGRYIPPITDEAIFPDYVRFGLRIHAGWDNWMGYDLLAANQRTDDFLRHFYLRHCGGG